MNKHLESLVLAGTALVVVAMLVTSCGNGGSKTDAAGAADAADGPESAYCDNARSWTVHELSGGGPAEDTPEAFRTYWTEYLDYLDIALREAPADIAEQEKIRNDGNKTLAGPVFEKFDYDIERLLTEGTPEEQAVWNDPPPADYQAAEEAITTYSDRVCGTGGPPAADVAFEDDGSGDAYCSASADFDGVLAPVFESSWDPAVLQAVVESPDYEAGLDTVIASAPAAIAADVEVHGEWLRKQFVDVVKSFDFDVRRLLLEGSPQDVAIFQQTDPAVGAHYSREIAFFEQICSE